MRIPLLLGAALVAAAAAHVAETADPAPGRNSTPPAERAAQVRELDIEFYRARTERNTLSARDHALLAGLYLQRARESGDQADLVRAEQAARRSLRLRQGRNELAFGVLASSLLGQHRFPEARQAAARLLAADTTSPDARGMLAEAELELGNYAEARRLFGMLASYSGEPAVAARLARWRELQGRPEEARRLLRRARAVSADRYGTPPEQLAWFALRLGDLALRHGRLGEAEWELERGLRIAPNDYRLLGALARLRLVRREPARAAEAAERAIARTLDPATLGVLHDAYVALGDPGRAATAYRALARAVLDQPGPYHRAWSLFLLDHGLENGRVLDNAEGELRTRRDVYGYDLLGWALHKQGRHREARRAARQALQLGTRDATLHYHAGMIDRALGLDRSATDHLRTALALNPYWDPVQPAVARLVLDTLAP
jgi:tetratricopeptide (TPR) repeat protein